MKILLWDQRIASSLVRPLVNTPVTPNQVTTVSLLFSLANAVMLATGDRPVENWGAALFMLGRFLDHFVGELARQSSKTSRFGHVYD